MTPPPVGGYGPDDPNPIRPYLRSPAQKYQPAELSPVEPQAEVSRLATPGPSPKLRPFVLTSGRVATDDPEIGLETQVTAHERGGRVPASRLSPELRAIVTLCVAPISIAEISARLRLHLGVVKILVGDLRATGYIDVHSRDAGTPNTPELILRVIRGLSAIS